MLGSKVKGYRFSFAREGIWAGDVGRGEGSEGRYPDI